MPSVQQVLKRQMQRCIPRFYTCWRDMSAVHDLFSRPAGRWFRRLDRLHHSHAAKSRGKAAKITLKQPMHPVHQPPPADAGTRARMHGPLKHYWGSGHECLHRRGGILASGHRIRGPAAIFWPRVTGSAAPAAVFWPRVTGSAAPRRYFGLGSPDPRPRGGILAPGHRIRGPAAPRRHFQNQGRRCKQKAAPPPAGTG